MKKSFSLTMLIVFIIALASLIGCGGEENKGSDVDDIFYGEPDDDTDNSGDSEIDGDGDSDTDGDGTGGSDTDSYGDSPSDKDTRSLWTCLICE